VRIHLISSPRNLSTALMYSFAQRVDTRVVDEPFYGYYLASTGVDHPGREETLRSLPHDVDGAFRMIDRFDDRTHLFLKGMAHHCAGIPIERLAEITSILFIRHPRRIIASFAAVIPNPTLRDIGIRMHVDLLRDLQAAGGRCLVLDSDDLLADPPGVLSLLCEKLGIPFDPHMLSWTAGARPEDGAWASHWYANVHRSTGFAKQDTSERPLPEHLKPLLDEALPYYETLRANRITT